MEITFRDMFMSNQHNYLMEPHKKYICANFVIDNISYSMFFYYDKEWCFDGSVHTSYKKKRYGIRANSINSISNHSIHRNSLAEVLWVALKFLRDRDEIIRSGMDSIVQRRRGKLKERLDRRNELIGPEWPTVRKQVLSEESICRMCGKEPSTEVDHILRMVSGGANSRDNLQGLCKSCHSKKTKWESKGEWDFKNNKRR